VVDVAEIRRDHPGSRLAHPSGSDKPLRLRLDQTSRDEPRSRDGGYDALATGHNLDDEAATLFGNT
jgi:hypothetical protein